MSQRGRRLLWGLIAAGILVRLLVAFGTIGVEFDIDSLRLIDGMLRADPLQVYTLSNHPQRHLPYLPAYFPIILLVGALSRGTGFAFHGLIQVPPIIADAAIAWLVQDYLGRRGASERTRLAAVALVALGPSFAVVSGFSGQFDSFAILPAVLALWLWDRLEPGHRRALVTGALIGLGAALKTVPGLMVLAFLPQCRSRREGALLLGAAVLVPLAMLAPFLVADPDGVRYALDYQGAAGVGGISLLAQPSLAVAWLNTNEFHGTGFTLLIHDLQPWIVTAALLGVGAVAFRYRPSPLAISCLLWLAMLAFGVNFFFNYVTWGLPFFLMAGYLAETALLQAALFIPTFLFYFSRWHGRYEDEGLVYLYVAIMVTVWAGLVAASLFVARRLCHS